MPPPPPFFVVGTGRCGTTLLQAMLSSHPRLDVPPETRFFARYDPLARCGADPLPDAQVDGYLAACARTKQWAALGLDSAGFEREVRAGMRSGREVFSWMLRQLGARSGKPRLGEKTPAHWLFARRILEWFPEARFIHVHRDPRDVVASLLAMPWWRVRDAAATALYCAQVLTGVRAAAREHPGRFLEVRYESLVGEPSVQLERACAFLGEGFDPAMLSFHQRSATGFVEQDRPFKALTLAPLTADRIGRFRSLLAPREVRTVERVLGPLLEEHGHRPEPGPEVWADEDAEALACLERAFAERGPDPEVWGEWVEGARRLTARATGRP